MSTGDDLTGPARYPRNRALRPGRRLGLLGLGLATYALSFLLSRAPGLAESLYGSGFGPLVVRALTFLTGWIPFSVGELLVLAYLLYLIRLAWTAAGAVRRRERTLGNALGSGVLRITRDAGVLVTLFYFTWGFNYARPSLEEKLGWQRPDSTSAEELAGLCESLIRAANEAYRGIHGVDDAGTPTLLPSGRDPLVEALEYGWVRARGSLGFRPLPEPSGRVKPLLLRPFFEWVGVVGFYFPFTAEPHVRGGVPAVDLGKALAHEMAHQRGVAREAEANFWGFLAAAHAPEPVARYSAYVFAQQQLLSALVRADRERTRALIDLRLPGVRRDLEASAEYWIRTRGSGVGLGRAANDAFLWTNRVEGGIRNYSQSALLFLAYARQRGGRIVP